MARIKSVHCLKNISLNKIKNLKSVNILHRRRGEMAEWLNASDLKLDKLKKIS